MRIERGHDRAHPEIKKGGRNKNSKTEGAADQNRNSASFIQHIESLFSPDDDRRGKGYSLDELIALINETGTKLERFPTIDTLEEYKKLVAEFLSHTLDNVRFIERKRHPRSPLQNPIQIRETIDEKLEELTDEIMRREKQHVHIAALIKDIRGILIDLKD